MRVRVASAGTGKTTSLVTRYLELIDDGVPLRRIAGVTFTRAAAQELRQRVGAGVREVVADGSFLGGLFVPHGRDPKAFARAEAELGGAVLSTIHGFMASCLRLNAPLLGLDPAMAVLGESEAAALFEEELRSLELLAEDPSDPLHSHLARAPLALDLARSLFKRRSLAAAFRFGETDLDAALAAVFETAYRRYRQRLGAVSLGTGELERRALQLLDSPTARKRVAERYPVVLVDEFQDVNPLQGAFFERLAASGARLELVGDPKQSIYLFRAADVSVFRRALAAAADTGEVLPPLVHTRRHSLAVTSFLNRLTDTLAERGLGFGPDEAPPVTPDGPQAAVEGAVELHVTFGEAPLADIRLHEAALLAGRLAAAHAQGMAFEAMAVVARSHRRLVELQDVLSAAGVPSLILKGRGYYTRSEVRDVYHALAVGIDPLGSSLAPFLRGPLAALQLSELAAVLQADDPLARLAASRPDVSQRLAALRSVSRLPPVEAIRRVVSEALTGGSRLIDMLGRRERVNLDALLLDIAANPPDDIEHLLLRLDELATADEQAVVPEGGAGVRLMTVHASKGLEYQLVAVFDAGGGRLERPAPLLVDPSDGRVILHAAGGDAAAQAAHRRREEQESFRLLYVAASRARDQLVITMSVNRQPRGWAAVLLELGLEGNAALPGVRLLRHDYRPQPAPATAAPRGSAAIPAGAAAPWIDGRVQHLPFEPVMSPSRLVGMLDARPEARVALTAEEEEPAEPRIAGSLALSAADPEAEALLAQPTGFEPAPPGQGRALGTLVHYAISQDWVELSPARLELLRAQEAMFPFAREQQDAILEEVSGLLGRYREMLGTSLPALEERATDRSEVPLAVAGGGTVWEGVLDRLYRVADHWVVEDYKTDRTPVPERYYVQLGLYLHAVERAVGVRPTGRLVFLRSGTVVEPEPGDLMAALAAAGVLGGRL